MNLTYPKQSILTKLGAFLYYNLGYTTKHMSELQLDFLSLNSDIIFKGYAKNDMDMSFGQYLNLQVSIYQCRIGLMRKSKSFNKFKGKR